MAYAKGDVYPYKKASNWEEVVAVLEQHITRRLHQEVARMEKDADVNAKNDEGETLLSRAAGVNEAQL
eukprot:3273515-Rhodomonas_salina.1